MAKPSPTRKEWLDREWIWGAILVVAVALAYQPMWWAEYIWDDFGVVFGNPAVMHPSGLKDIWTTSAADICPLTLTAFWAEFRLWGSNPLPYHIVNILEHAASAILLWRLLLLLRIPGAWLGAALWALHPVEVESVAWVTEMKNTQSGFFYLLTGLFFVKSLSNDADHRRNYGLALLFAAMAMASKSSTIILPVVLCLCAWWMEGRWHWRNLAKVAPMILMAGAATAASLWTQKIRLDAINDPQFALGWPYRIAVAGHAVWFYLWRLAWPHPLVMFFPKWEIDPARFAVYLPSLAVIVVLGVLWCYRRTWGRPFFFAFACFVAALLPVLGFVNNTIFALGLVFDHFQYLASMAPLALLGAGIARLKSFISPKNAWQVPALSTGLLALLGVTTWLQCWIYQSEATLWSYNLSWYPKSGQAHYYLGNSLVHEGHPKEALAEYNIAIGLMPNNSILRNTLSDVLRSLGRNAEAIAQELAALKLVPNSAILHANLGNIYLQQNRFDDAVASFQAALAIKPGDVESHFGLGTTFAKMNRTDDAIAQFRQAVEIDPNDNDSRIDLGVELLTKGKTDEAIDQFKEVLRRDPDNQPAKDDLAKAQAMPQPHQ